MAITTMIGARIHRREDPRLITGHGRFIDDMTRPGMAHMTVVRSPYAHAKIRSIDPSEARKAPGVQAVFTYADFKDHIAGGLPVSASFVAEKKQVPNQFPIAHDEVVYQGEPVAVVLADERYQAADAASLVKVEYDPLPAVMDIEKAMEKGRAAAWSPNTTTTTSASHSGPRVRSLISSACSSGRLAAWRRARCESSRAPT